MAERDITVRTRDIMVRNGSDAVDRVTPCQGKMRLLGCLFAETGEKRAFWDSYFNNTHVLHYHPIGMW